MKCEVNTRWGNYTKLQKTKWFLIRKLKFNFLKFETYSENPKKVFDVNYSFKLSGNCEILSCNLKFQFKKETIKEKIKRHLNIK